MQLINEQTEPEKSGEQVLDLMASDVEPKGNILGECT